MIALINNKFIGKPCIPLTDSILRGYGIFETLRTYNKQFLREDLHIKRLFKSAEQISLKIAYSKEEVIKMLHKIKEKSPFLSQRIKIIATEEKLILISTPEKIDEKIYKGVKCLSVNTIRSIPEIKSISYLPSYLAHENAVKKGYFEAILIDDENEVYEGAYSNIFWFEENFLCTREREVLPGITREIILQISPFKIKFKNIKVEELYQKEEVFLTSSVKNIVPITEIDEKIIGEGKPGLKTIELRQLFLSQIKS